MGIDLKEIIVPSGRHHIKAIIYNKRGIPLSIGENSYVKTHPWQAALAKQTGNDTKVYQHAEIAAIVRCPNLAKAYKISIFRFTKDGKPALAKPCPVCERAIALSGIKYVEHT